MRQLICEAHSLIVEESMTDANQLTNVRRAGRPPSIRREQIVAAALELGIAGLTLRKLAQRLGVSSQALYRYFPNLEALLDAVVDELDKRIPLPPDHGEGWCDWRTSLRTPCAVCLNRRPAWLTAHSSERNRRWEYWGAMKRR